MPTATTHDIEQCIENCTRCHPDYGAGVTAAIAAVAGS